MGCLSSREDRSVAHVWVNMKNYEDDGTLVFADNPQYAGLRSVLDVPVGQLYLAEFANSREFRKTEQTTKAIPKGKGSQVVKCWVAIENFRGANHSELRKKLGKQIYNLYMADSTAVFPVGSISNEEEIRDAIKSNDSTKFYAGLFAPFHRMVFRWMAENIYEDFVESNEYDKYKARVNYVSEDDFEYYNSLGQGGFARVCRVGKRTTNRMYAMKVTLKAGMLHEYRNSKQRVTTERDLLVNIGHHPFIVGCHYALQTDKYAILVLDLVRGGDLDTYTRRWRHTHDNQGLPVGQVRFIIAELVLALEHLHENGVVHRDIKPQNVLLDEDGHLKLTDMGISKKTATAGACKTFVGTEFYRAPEMFEVWRGREKRKADRLERVKKKVTVSLRSRKDDNADELSMKSGAGAESRRQDGPSTGTNGGGSNAGGSATGTNLDETASIDSSVPKSYGSSVDWWAVGVMMYRLLTTRLPFVVAEQDKTQKKLKRENEHEIITKIVLEFDEGNGLGDADLEDFCQSLLEVNPERRLGCRPAGGVKELKAHPFFKEIAWERMMNRQAFSPLNLDVIGGRTAGAEDDPYYPNFKTMIKTFPKAGGDKGGNGMGAIFPISGWDDEPEEDDQAYFDQWNYVSREAVKLEAHALKFGGAPVPMRGSSRVGEERRMSGAVANVKARRLSTDFTASLKKISGALSRESNQSNNSRQSRMSGNDSTSPTQKPRKLDTGKGKPSALSPQRRGSGENILATIQRVKGKGSAIFRRSKQTSGEDFSEQVAARKSGDARKSIAGTSVVGAISEDVPSSFRVNLKAIPKKEQPKAQVAAEVKVKAKEPVEVEAKAKGSAEAEGEGVSSVKEGAGAGADVQVGGATAAPVDDNLAKVQPIKTVKPKKGKGKGKGKGKKVKKVAVAQEEEGLNGDAADSAKQKGGVKKKKKKKKNVAKKNLGGGGAVAQENEGGGGEGEVEVGIGIEVGAAE